MTTQRITIDLTQTDAETARTWASTIQTMLVESRRPHAVMVETIPSPPAPVAGPWEVQRLRPDSPFYFVRHKGTLAAYGMGGIMTEDQAERSARRLNRFPCTAGTCSHKHPMD